MFLSKNPDISTLISYLQLCHNYWDSEAGYSKTKVIYSFGREDQLDRKVLERLVDSINRYLNPEEAMFAKDKIVRAADFSFVLAKKFGGVWALDQLWRFFCFDVCYGFSFRGKR
nr:hypothetical protein [Anoxybacter fermentans]